MVKLEKIVSDLASEDRRLRIDAAKKLGDIRDEKAIKPLIGSLKDIDPDVRLAASDSLFKIGSVTVDYLIKALDEDNNNLLLRVIELLGEIGDKRGINPLINFLDEKNNVFIRIAAVKSLAAFDDSRIIDPLISILTDKRYMLRIAAVDALGDVGDESVKEILKESLLDESYMVREAAKESIEKIEYKITNFEDLKIPSETEIFPEDDEISINDEIISVDSKIIENELAISQKTCQKCGESKNLEDFYKNRREDDGLSRYCKDCLKSYDKKTNKHLKSKLDNIQSQPAENPLKLLKNLRK